MKRRRIPPAERHAFCFQFGCILGLDGSKHHGILYVSVYHGNAKYLKPMLDGRGASRPKPADVGGLLSGFGNITGINGNCQPFHSILETIGGEIHIEAQPAEILTESLTIALLSASPVASKLKKVYLSRYAHD